LTGGEGIEFLEAELFHLVLIMSGLIGYFRSRLPDIDAVEQIQLCRNRGSTGMVVTNRRRDRFSRAGDPMVIEKQRRKG